MDLYSTKLLVTTLTFSIAYITIVTLSGSFRAWVAGLMGDQTAEYEGFLTLNPMMHISFIGYMFLVLQSFGWGKHVPINPLNIYGKFRPLKLATAFFSNTVLHIIFAITGLFILIAWFDPMMITIVQLIILKKNISHLYIAQYYPLYSSLSVSLAFILAAWVALNTGLAVLEFLLNVCLLGMHLIMGSSINYMEYSFYFMFLAPLLLMIFFYGPLLVMVTYFITYAGLTLAYLIQAI
jgi:hypothetical protein